ncbi:unnamed protein product [Ilex paraguariensis]|uniref:Ribosomal protein eL8/eL30/eS12/Gadd45 domain-containing protein n=1 Tax=Ilex paraguariensis TaxID=185542 RepID=A0ABC8S6K1_9AQUA
MRCKTRHSNDASSSGTRNLDPPQHQNNLYEGERLGRFIKSIEREIESARLSNTTLPHKFWLKQQFSIGVNEVTRALECMTQGSSSVQGHTKASSVQLQAILLASDCNPRWLTKHLPSLASSRKVPLIYVKDKKGGSLKLGELVKLKTAIAIGARGNALNRIIEEILRGNEIPVGMEG